MENNNVPVEAIQKVLGHETSETTEIYLHTARDSQRRAIEAYEQACEKAKLHEDSHTKSHTDSAAA